MSRPAESVVVVVCDAAQLRRVVADRLRRGCGARVLEMAGGEGAVAWVRVLNPRLVVAVGDGAVAVTDRLRCQPDTRGVPILALRADELGEADAAVRSCLEQPSDARGGRTVPVGGTVDAGGARPPSPPRRRRLPPRPAGASTRL